MADDSNVITLPLPKRAPAAPVAKTSRFPLRPKKRVRIDDPAEVVKSVLQYVRDVEGDRNRGEWLTRRIQRYAKFRGWLDEKSYPWPGCSNVHLPILMTSGLRASAGLHNVIMTLRPLMTAKAASRAGIEREEKITQTLQYQMFLEPGPEIAERRFSDFIDGGLYDGNAVAYTPWVRDEREMTEVRFAPAIPDGASPADVLEAEFRRALPNVQTIEMHETKDHCFYVTFTDGTRDAEAKIEVFEDEDGDLELLITRERTIYDGPVMLPLPIESVIVPTRCTNLQPPSEANPTGAARVVLRWRYRLDDVKRLMDSGQFNWLDAKGFDKIVAAARGAAGTPFSGTDTDRDALQEQKDTIEGREHREGEATLDAEVAQLTAPFLLAFDLWDVDGDGLSEHVFWVIAEDAEVLCEARLTTDRWPAVKPYRPLAEWCPIPVKDRWYGISMLELGESLYDLIKGTFDQSYDGWSVANLPFFFYGAGSKLNTNILNVAPAQGIPVPGNPRETLLFPNLPQRDQSGALGIISLGMRFYESLMSQGQLQSGQVPTGKASALRTFGTTQALLQQGDVRADQMLIRLFQGLGQVALNFHRMNRHLLPDGKEIRVLGWDGPQHQGYQTIRASEDLDAEIEFEFRPEFLNSNPETLRLAIEKTLGVLVQPLMLEIGVTDATTIHRLVRDFVKAQRLDAKRYVNEPTITSLPPVLAEEAIQLLMRGQEIRGIPLEGAAKHLATLQTWATSEAFALLPEAHAPLAKAWFAQVAQLAQQERLAAAAAQYQAALQSGAGPGGGVPTTIQEPSDGGAVTTVEPPPEAA